MLDVRLLREDPQGVREKLARKKFSANPDAVLELDEVRRARIREAEEARAGQKRTNSEMAALKKGSPEFLEKVAEMKSLAAKVKELEAAARESDQAFTEAWMALPNLPHDSVPVGRGEAENQVVRRSSFKEEDWPDAVPHWEIPGFEEAFDFQRGVKVSGAGFPFYRGPAARLVRCLIDHFLDAAARDGYTEVHAPLLVNAASATATGQLPDKEGQMYSTREDELFLIPTAEVPVTNFFRDEILSADSLPLRLAAYTPCFRREAGSWGKDVRGLNRLHQFDKVERVIWEHPERSFEALEQLVSEAEALLLELELPYRVLSICSGDLGFPHAKQYDLEVWSAGQGRWLEVSSCSNFTDFQARRGSIRFRDANSKPCILHTLNGSALALPRVIAALLENGHGGGGEVRLPKVLSGRMGSEVLRLGKE